jgi:hypothetical protein
VRLDHLLSKELLASVAVVAGAQSRASGECPGGGCSWVDTSTSWLRVVCASSVRLPVVGGRGRERGVWRWVAWARCWVLRERALVARPSGWGLRWTVRRLVAGGVWHRLAGLSRPYLENCTVDAKHLYLCGQVSKGTRWMPRHQEPMKDVGACDKPRGAGNQAVIRGSPNGGTRLESCPVTRA